MSYNPSIPQAANLIANSQSAILGNFTAIDPGTSLTGVGFARNHVTMTDTTNGGLHSRVDYFQNVSDPSVSGFVSSLYSKLVSSIAAPYFANAGGATAVWTGGTGTGQVTAVTGSGISNGHIILGNGIVLQWGAANITTGTGTQTITFPFTFPNNVFMVTGSVYSGTPTPFGVNIASGHLLPASFGINTNVPGAAIFLYLAIGN